MKTVSGVESVAMSTSFPFNPAGIVNGPQANQYIIQGKVLPPGAPKPTTDIKIVTAGYFETIRQPIVKGRTFNAHDDEPAAVAAVIVNQSFVRHQFPGEDPIGKRISPDDGEHWGEIVGVAGDVKEYGLDQPVADVIYGALRTGYIPRLIVRTSADPKAIAPLVREAMRQLDPLVAIDQVQSVERAEYESLASPRVMMFLLGMFAVLAVIISACGIAAVMALTVSQRTREIGVRIALGARPGRIVNMVVRQGLVLAVAGAAVGTLGALGLTRMLSTLLFGTSPSDLPTYIGVTGLFLAVAVVACLIPARQVTSIDPLTALRQE
jgi:putative ABC transport system permease protein